MDKNFDIAITTFSLRYHFIENLISKIRSFGVENNILICINGELESQIDEEYRKKILHLCSIHEKIFPIFFINLRGLSKMWNSLIIHAGSENILMLNDDIDLESPNMFEVVSQHINHDSYKGLSVINNTFSFFVVNKLFIDNLGYFDERLLGFGEEDGDITFRIKKKYNRDIDRLYCGGVTNIVSDIRHEKVKPGISKYSLFNREYMFKEKYDCIGDIYHFPGIECSQKLPDPNAYPYENFYLVNKNRI